MRDWKIVKKDLCKKIFTARKWSFRQSNIFTGVWPSTVGVCIPACNGQRGVHPSMQWGRGCLPLGPGGVPPGQTPPDTHPPWANTSPGQTPLRTDTPLGRHSLLRNDHWSGWYAFYWNVFLLSIKTQALVISSTLRHWSVWVNLNYERRLKSKLFSLLFLH